MDLTRSDHPFVNTLAIGDIFDGFYVLRTIQLATTKSNKPYLVMDLSDKTGHIKGKMWDDADHAYKGLKENIVVKIRAMVGEFQGRKELKVLRIRPADEDAGDMTRFMPISERDPEDDWSIIREAAFRMQDQGLQKLMNNLLEDEAFVESFQQSPAGKRWHHSYLGGLLEHSASMVKLAGRLGDHYPYLNRDLLITGTFLHDVGKLFELKHDLAIDYTVRGRLLGHITIGAQFIRDKIDEVGGIDEETATHLLHLVLSHQGENENGSPVVPMTREAFVLYFLDEIDSKLNAVTRELEKAEGGGGSFTEYINLLGRMLYKGGGFSEEKEITDFE